MKHYIKWILLMISIAGLSIGCGQGSKTSIEEAEQVSSTEQPATASLEAINEDDIVILYTTDVHHKLDDYIGYDGVAAYRKEAARKCTEDNLLLVDCGDCLDGGNLGENTYGSGIMKIMEKAGYDVATPGNHDYKYGVDNLKKLAEDVDFDYISCNIREIATGSTVLEPYTILQRGGKNIAFIGVSVTANLTSVNENPKYDFWEDGFYEHVQEVIEEVHSKGADYVILLTHLGYDSSEFSSSELIGKTTGVDAVIDGHAHVEREGELLADKDGKMVTITSAGEWLKNIGQLIIHPDGTIETQLIPMIDYLNTDEEVTQYIEQLEME